MCSDWAAGRLHRLKLGFTAGADQIRDSDFGQQNCGRAVDRAIEDTEQYTAIDSYNCPWKPLM